MKIIRFLIILFLFLTSYTSASSAEVFSLKRDDQKTQDTTTFKSQLSADNEHCLKCHGQGKYEYTNETLGKQIRALMCSERIIKREEFYNSNHKNFSCTDCHSEQYSKFPHPGELRMEQKLNCIDCHGGDPKFAQYHFEEIDTEYKQSIHYKLEPDGFSCWKCHNPHSYKINIRNSLNIKETILYDNSICLNCHANFDRFQLLTDRKEIDILKTHEWLPNQAAHFLNVRCIECHTRVNDSILVSHFIRPKKEAVRLCNECHSQNSLLMSSLYKFRSKEQRHNNGFVNGVILNESYVIGANRNSYLNLFSLLGFLAILIIITVHVIFRIKKLKKIQKGGQDVSIS
jgi:mono/diheme cytochrome c family protein